jgi:exodeoxyribonuclease V
MDNITTTGDQRTAISTCVSRLKAREPVTKLFGYAGTGKTTIAKMIAEELGGRVAFASYTGKAASVLTRKGCPAQTIHSMFYQHEGETKVAGKMQPVFSFVKDKGGMPRALILDEVSMVDDAMGADIMSVGIPVLAIGDPAQLPPVKDGGYFTNGQPDVMLTEVIRHDGRVLKLATDVRENGVKAISKREYRDMVSRQIGQSQAVNYDQVLTGRNETRRDKNDTMRFLKGFESGEFISVGDRIICTANNSTDQVLNGQQFRVLEILEPDDREYTIESMITLMLECECRPVEESDRKRCPICGWVPEYIPVWVAGFVGERGENWLTKQPFFKRKKAMEATYGYAITVHKSQGSEWGNVLIVNESWCFRKDATRWLYTAITRAQENVMIISGRK